MQTNPNGLVVQLTTEVLQDLQNINLTVITIQQLQVSELRAPIYIYIVNKNVNFPSYYIPIYFQMYIEGNISNIELAINESQCHVCLVTTWHCTVLFGYYSFVVPTSQLSNFTSILEAFLHTLNTVTSRVSVNIIFVYIILSVVCIYVNTHALTGGG